MSRVNPLFFFTLDVVTHADTVMVVVPAIPTRLGRMLLDSHGGLVLPNPLAILPLDYYNTMDIYTMYKCYHTFSIIHIHIYSLSSQVLLSLSRKCCGS